MEDQRLPKMQVIVGGLPRTGTTSMSRALEILLKGKVFDGGHVSYFGPSDRQHLLLDLASRCPTRSPTDRTAVLHILAQLTQGHVATTDQPGCYFLEELLHLYPDAKVIITTRDEHSWWESYKALWSSIHALYQWSWFSPQLDRFCRFSFEFWRRVPQAVGLTQCEAWPVENQRGLWEAHAAYVRRVVPRERLFYFDVKSGWGPLCEILGVDDVPEEAFPHAMPREWIVEGKDRVLEGLKRRLWLGMGGLGLVLGAGAFVGKKILQRRL